MKKDSLKGIVCTFAVAFVVGFSIIPAHAQQGSITRTWGLSASIQTGQMDILIPIWTGDTFVLAPGFSLNYIENVTTNIGVEVVPRLYLDNSRVSPYLTGMAGLLFRMPTVGSDTSDLMLGIGLGGEYFVNPKFSFGVEARLNGSVIDVSGARNILLYTSAAVVANVYF